MKIFDGHNDTFLHLFLPDSGEERSFFERSAIGQLDLPRAKLGDFAGGLFAICPLPPKSWPESDPHYGLTITENGYTMLLPRPLKYAYARKFTDNLVAFFHHIEKESNGSVKIARTFHEVEFCFKEDILSVVLHFEGAEAIATDLSNLDDYYDQGLRSLGLVWSRPNVFGNGVPFAFPHSPDTGDGLTEAGKKLVKACNRLGIIVDLAHINEKGFWDVAKISDKPLTVSHAGVYSLCPSTRNLTDVQLDAIGKSDGIVGIIFEPINTRADGKLNADTPLSVIVDHIEHVVDRIGIDHVGFGSDFDGADMPHELKDVAGLQKLIDCFVKKGYDTDSIEKIAFKNWWRVLRNTWRDDNHTA